MLHVLPLAPAGRVLAADLALVAPGMAAVRVARVDRDNMATALAEEERVRVDRRSVPTNDVWQRSKKSPQVQSRFHRRSLSKTWLSFCSPQ